jgi:uncharacterized membrane protein HdeD (DUF308 family)
MASTQLVPEYTTEQVKAWMGDRKKDTSNAMDITLSICTLLGLVICGVGVIQVMSHAKARMEGGGDGHKGGWTMIFIGAALGIVGGLLLLVITLVKPT